MLWPSPLNGTSRKGLLRPSGALAYLRAYPRACALGFILAPLRG